MCQNPFARREVRYLSPPPVKAPEKSDDDVREKERKARIKESEKRGKASTILTTGTVVRKTRQQDVRKTLLGQ